MKILITIIRWTVGLLFIFSGLIKANDPLGLSYKMLEFFEAWGFHFLDNYTLSFSIIMNICEVLAGVAIIIGWRMRFFSWFLLGLIIFFTFLTAYVLFSGKIKECGCFGDCIPLSALQTFIKDLILLVLIIFIFFNAKNVKPLFHSKISALILSTAVISGIALQWYVLNYLPFLDCLPYKKGADILNEMKVPAGAVPDSFAITFKYKKNNQVVEFDQEHFPTDFDSTYEFLDRYDKLIRKGNASPRIADFSLRSIDGVDTTSFILHQHNKYLLLFAKDFSNVNEWVNDFRSAISLSQSKNIPVYLITADADKAVTLFKNISILKCDATVIKTAARVNPTYFIMQDATVLHKLGFRDAQSIIQLLNEVK
jgi:uncharacterized membrane protein YphA (DoxX/SURF4 family)